MKSLTGQLSRKLNDAIAVISFSDASKQIDAEILNGKIETVLRLIQSIRIQSPSSHTGPVLVFSSISEIPFPADAGISFGWYRITNSNGNHVRTQINNISGTYYLPTIDDIGSQICAQFEDDYEQGLSRQLEVMHKITLSIGHEITYYTDFNSLMWLLFISNDSCNW